MLDNAALSEGRFNDPSLSIRDDLIIPFIAGSAIATLRPVKSATQNNPQPHSADRKSLL